jgi:hypothetical protein
MFAWHRRGVNKAKELISTRGDFVKPAPKLPMYNAIPARLALLPPRVTTVRKWHDATVRLPGAIAAEMLRRAFS